ncbi:iron-sulfur cluster assembly scaffold protein, partial [Nitrospinaceae bacterium]|nr:iron-sulfur cluster assembly scaffold protein [Nitrospinaceae bacterium]
MSYDKELYQQVILDHNRKPRNFHEIEGASHSCHGVNPLCGDDITVYLNID